MAGGKCSKCEDVVHGRQKICGNCGHNLARDRANRLAELRRLLHEKGKRLHATNLDKIRKQLRNQVYRLQGAGVRVALLSVRVGDKTTVKMDLFEDPVLEKSFMEVDQSGTKVINKFSEAILKAFLHGALESDELQRCSAEHKLRGFTADRLSSCSGPPVTDTTVDAGVDADLLSASSNVSAVANTKKFLFNEKLSISSYAQIRQPHLCFLNNGKTKNKPRKGAGRRKVKDDPPDLKPDLAPCEVKDEYQDSIATTSARTDYPPDLKPGLAPCEVNDEYQRSIAATSARTDDPPSGTPDLSTFVEIKEEVVDIAGPSSFAQDFGDLTSAPGSFDDLEHTVGRHDGRSNTGKISLDSDLSEKLCSSDGRVSQRLVQAGERQHGCSVCGKVFSKAAYLARHRLTHSGEKTHICDDCGKPFARKEHLTNHRLTHTGENRYRCDDCGNSFARKAHLPNYSFTHAGEKPYR